MDTTHIHRQICGFTLVEVAVVLFIVTLVMSGIISLFNAMVVNQKIEATKVKQEAIKTALISFIARNYRLPCPALATLAAGATNEGIEAASPGTCTGIPISGSAPNQVVTGVIPWVTLGLTAEAALDAYANRFTYQVVLSTTGLTATTISGLTGRITIHGAGLGILGAAPTGNQTNDCSGGATVNPCAAVAVIVSHGKNGYGAYTRTGIQIPFDSGITGNDARENANGDSMFVIKDYSGNDANPFDDSVMALTASDLLTPLLIAGTFKDYRATLNNTFQIMQAAAVAYGVNNRSGSAGSRSYPIPDSTAFSSLLSASQISDPWGTSIIYTKNGTAITTSAGANDLAFTLTSHGPDKAPGGGDDIVRDIRAGELQSIFQLSGW